MQLLFVKLKQRKIYGAKYLLVYHNISILSFPPVLIRETYTYILIVLNSISRALTATFNRIF